MSRPFKYPTGTTKVTSVNMPILLWQRIKEREGNVSEYLVQLVAEDQGLNPEEDLNAQIEIADKKLLLLKQEALTVESHKMKLQHKMNATVKKRLNFLEARLKLFRIMSGWVEEVSLRMGEDRVRTAIYARLDGWVDEMVEADLRSKDEAWQEFNSWQRDNK